MTSFEASESILLLSGDTEERKEQKISKKRCQGQRRGNIETFLMTHADASFIPLHHRIESNKARLRPVIFLIVFYAITLSPSVNAFVPRCTSAGCRMTSSLNGGIFGRPETNRTRTSAEETNWIEWEVYVDSSKNSLDRGGAATLDALVGLSNPSIQIIPCQLKTKLKGPVVRCVAVNQNTADSFDVANVDSVDKVYRLLTRHMRVKVSRSLPSKDADSLHGPLILISNLLSSGII